MLTSDPSGWSIREVAARTGVAIPVLRSWEERHGFPRPDRLPGGHRRYSSEEVDRIERVVRARAAGWSLERAIAQVSAPEPQDTTVFAALRRARPDLVVRALSRRAMLAVSRSIEDECCAVAERPLLAASFQSEATYRAASARWTDLARTASSTIVLAGFERSAIRDGVHEVSVDPASPLLREWTVICDAPGASACLAGWERPGEGRFEAVWTVDPTVVRQAADLACRLAAHHAPELAIMPPDRAAVEPPDAGTILRRAEAVANRVVAYLDR